MDPLAGIRAIFHEEAQEWLGDIEQELLTLTAETAGDIIDSLFRHVHSLKGGAASFGYAACAAISHEMEQLLSLMRQGELTPDARVTDLLLTARDAAAATLRDEASTAEPYLELIDALRSCHDGTTLREKPDALPAIFPAAASVHTIALSPKPALFAGSSDPLKLFGELAQLGALTVNADASRLPDLHGLEPEECYIDWQLSLTAPVKKDAILDVFLFAEDDFTLSIDTAPLPIPLPLPNPPQTTLRVMADTIDQLLRLSESIVTAHWQLGRSLAALHLPRHSGIHNDYDQLSTHARQLQNLVITLRLQPLRPIFTRLPRLVRDLSHTLGKQVHFTMEGAETEIDRAVVDALADPLTHLLRNALDHGIEPPETRTANGKPAEARLQLTARALQGRVQITLSDDGAGIDRARLRQRLMDAGHAVPESDAELDETIFLPGLSTAKTISEISGRGVGLDIVKTTLQALGGMIKLENRPGSGVTFTLSLPMMLAVMEVLVLRQHNEFYALPLGPIVALQRLENSRNALAGSICVHDEAAYPLRFLDETHAAQCMRPSSDAAATNAVLLQTADTRFALVVQEAVGIETIALRPLSLPFQTMRCFSGAALLKNGSLAFVIDPFAFGASASLAAETLQTGHTA